MRNDGCITPLLLCKRPNVVSPTSKYGHVQAGFATTKTESWTPVLYVPRVTCVCWTTALQLFHSLILFSLPVAHELLTGEQSHVFRD